MTALACSILAVLFLTDPREGLSEEAAGAGAPRAKAAAVTSASVTSRSCDVDGEEGVVLFEGDVVVAYAKDFTMCADRVYMFLAGTNDVSRVVAVGGVTITNETRVGSCDMATYRRRRGEIEMLGDAPGRTVRLDERGGASRSVVGSRIRFWLGAEQVMVEDSRITAERTKGEGVP